MTLDDPALATDRQSYVLVPFDDVELHPRNARRADIPSIVASIRQLGWFGACGRQASTGYLIWGNGRYQAGRIARDLMARAAAGETVPDAEEWRAWPGRFGGPLERLPVFDLDVDDEAALLILVRDNNTSDRADYDRPALASLLDEIGALRGGYDETGYSRTEIDDLIRDGGDTAPARAPSVSLADRFLVPPFSVLDARQGYWQDRKREWLSLGIRSEIGRDDGSLIPSLSGRVPDYYAQKRAAEGRLGRDLELAEFEADHLTIGEGSGLSSGGTSVFDPVVAELAVRWYCPPGGRILDPFAGGSVRGIVASRLGRPYVGVDLSAEQVAANREQLTICRDEDPTPEWIVGDARDVRDRLSDTRYDLVLSCPPYFNLERYSDDPADLSNAADWPAFCAAYEDALVAATSLLYPGSFAVLVVGNLRDREGRILDLVAASTASMAVAGLALYNDAILVTTVGSLPIRVGRSFAAGRKLGRTHQYVLVYLKPPLDEALAKLGDVEIGDLEQLLADPIG